VKLCCADVIGSSQKFVQQLLQFEPQTVYASPDASVAESADKTMVTMSKLADRELVATVAWAKQVPGMFWCCLFSYSSNVWRVTERLAITHHVGEHAQAICVFVDLSCWWYSDFHWLDSELQICWLLLSSWSSPSFSMSTFQKLRSFSYLQGSCGSLKVLEFFFQIFKAWKVLENRHGPWKSLNLCLKVLESAWIWFSKMPWPNKWFSESV